MSVEVSDKVSRLRSLKSDYDCDCKQWEDLLSDGIITDEEKKEQLDKLREVYKHKHDIFTAI